MAKKKSSRSTKKTVATDAACHPSHGEAWALDEKGNRIPGTGRRLIYAKRCSGQFLGKQCIGVKGHEGHHWRYDDLGHYWWWKDKCRSKFDIAGGQTPDGHEDYVRPSERHSATHVACGRSEPIDG